MKSHTRVVVIGGGIMGAGLLYHLTKEGWSDVVLVEKGELTSGSTWHAAAFVPHFMGNPGMARIHRYASEIYSRLEAETGQATGWHGCGTIRLGYNKDEMDWYRHVQGMLHSQGTECHLIGPEEIAKLHPLMNVDGVKVGIYTPGDGHTDPAGSTNALAIGARAGGAEIYLRNRVIDINKRADGSWDVITENGTIVAEHVVNATGSFSPQVGAMVGAKVPVVSIPHHYLVTEKLDEVIALDEEIPTVRDPHASCYYRQEQQGLIVGPYEMEGAETWGLNGVDWSFDTELLPPNLDVLMPCLEAAGKRIPAFANAGIKRVVNGPITHAPDLGILIGPAVGFQNFWLCCGSSVGVTQGPGAGKYLAQWMVHGQAEIDISAMDARRYGDWAVGDYAVEKSLNGYHKMFQVQLPGEYRDAGRPVRTSPIYDRLKARGARFAEKFGWEVPNWFAPEGVEERYGFRRSNWFDTVAAECKAVRERVGIMDRSSLAKFEVSGADANAFLDWILSSRLPEKDGDIINAYALTELGGIECQFNVIRWGESCYHLHAAAVSQMRSLDWLTRYSQQFDNVTINDITNDYAVLALEGPRSGEVLAKLTDQGLENEAFPSMSAREIEIAGVPTRVLRVSNTGESGWELHHSMDHMETLYDRLLGSGAEFDIADYGLYAANSLRMEKAYKAWGSDVITPTTAIEAGLEHLMSRDKQYIGRSTVEMRAEDSNAKKLVYLTFDAEDAEAFGNEQVFSSDRAVGTTTSGAYGHTVAKSIAFAYVAPEFAPAGTELEIEIMGHRCPAQVVDGALYDPENLRIQG